MRSLHQNKPEQPFHVSVGAVVVNAKGEVLVHKRTPETTPPQYLHTLGGLNECYTLMRETIEDNEPIEQAVLRGVREEFGIEGKIRMYLGSIQARAEKKDGTPWEKTTLYYLVIVEREGVRSTDDGEAHTELVWERPESLLEKMKEQGARSQREDLDESKIIDTYLRYGTT